MKLVTAVIQPFEIGDGRIFVFDLQQAIRVRTGETGSQAL
jgi:nitrogen regulatory protein P-II 2